MKYKTKAAAFFVLFSAMLLTTTLTSCSSGGPEDNAVVIVTSVIEEQQVEEVIVTSEVEVIVTQEVEVQVDSMPEAAAESAGEESGITQSGGGQDFLILARSDRMIIKNAEIKLLVEDTDTAIDRATQVVSDVGGYIISSRVWYVDWGEESYKYSSLTIGVPVDEFERAMRRFRDIAIRVIDENATGQDVTDQFVDLESRKSNLEATRDRIRSFLDQAETVEEALQVNEELSEIEGQIEEIQGRMNYLKDRSANSTITIDMEPELPPIPTATAAPTATASPTSTPIPWKPSETAGRAVNVLRFAYQGFIDASIWLFIVVLPVVAPLVAVLWLISKFILKRPFFRRAKETPTG